MATQYKITPAAVGITYIVKKDEKEFTYLVFSEPITLCIPTKRVATLKMRRDAALGLVVEGAEE